MPPFSVNTTRLDPYKNFKWRVKWDGKYCYGGSKLTGLKRSTEVVEHRAGGDPSTSHKSPGRNKYEAITLERGLTQDLAFHDWAGLVWNFGAALGAEVSLASFRKNLYLELYNEAGQLVIARTRSIAAGFPNIRPSRIWMPMPTPWPLSTSRSRTKAGSATRASPRRWSRR